LPFLFFLFLSFFLSFFLSLSFIVSRSPPQPTAARLRRLSEVLYALTAAATATVISFMVEGHFVQPAREEGTRNGSQRANTEGGPIVRLLHSVVYVKFWCVE
jgi:hypothetical protein